MRERKRRRRDAEAGCPFGTADSDAQRRALLRGTIFERGNRDRRHTYAFGLREGQRARHHWGRRTARRRLRIAESARLDSSCGLLSFGWELRALTLGGGLGILGRKYGLTSDQLLGAQIVLADGRIVDCDASQDGELFWALRGAGAGNFGVVTSLPTSYASGELGDELWFDLVTLTQAAAVIEAWQEWAPAAPDELYASVLVTAPADVQRPPAIDLLGSMLGSEADTAQLLNTFWSSGPAKPRPRRFTSTCPAKRRSATRQTSKSPIETKPARKPPGTSSSFKSPSSSGGSLPAEAIAQLLPDTPNGRSSGSGPRVRLLPLGRRLQPRPRRCHRFRPSPRAVLTQTGHRR